MIAYDVAYKLLDDQTFQIRIRYAMLRTAAAILAEDPNVKKHQARVEWAQKALVEGLQMPFRQVLLNVITDPNVSNAGAAVSDAQIQAAVDALSTVLVAGG